MKKRFLAMLLGGAMMATMMVACAPKEEKAPEAPQTEDTTAPEADNTADESAQSEDAPAPEASGETHKVILITMDRQDQHWVNVDAGAQKAVAELGNIDYQWMAPDVKDDAKQIEQINNAVAAGAEVILIAANGPDSMVKPLEEAANSGVKIIYVDSPANFKASQTFSTDNKAAGKTAGEEMIKALEAKGVTSGKVGIVNINAATTSTVDREAGFREAFDGKGFEILETQYGDGDIAKSKDIAASYITQGAVGIFSANEGSTVGTGNAIQESGQDIIGIGFDKSDAILELIKNGYVVAAMSQNPDVMGYDGMMAASKLLAGEELSPEVVDTGVSVITKDSIG